MSESSLPATENASTALPEAIAAAPPENLCVARRDERIFLPFVLFFLTCLSTFWTGAVDWKPFAHLDSFDKALSSFWQNVPQGVGPAFHEAFSLLELDVPKGLTYMAAVLGILLTHEMGHFFMAWRYGIPASLPYFIPIPVLPFGTMGAVIGMEGSEADRKQLFDLSIAGPLAGLFVALPITWLGILQLPADPAQGTGYGFHCPLVFQLLIEYLRPDYPSPTVIYLNQFNPFLMAGWVGMFVTGLNMLPVSQLDGGHASYALLDKQAHSLARGVLILAIGFVLLSEQYGWIIMLIIVIMMGIDHPATKDDSVTLGGGRRAIGWLALLIPIFCLSPIGITPPGR